MRRTVSSFVIACVCVLGITVVAQDKPQDKPQSSGQKEHTMTGCLQKGSSPDTFIVMNTAGKGPKTIGIVESKANLAPHVGHTIDITGTAVPGTEAQGLKPTPPAADHYMRISAIKMVAANCK